LIHWNAKHQHSTFTTSCDALQIANFQIESLYVYVLSLVSHDVNILYKDRYRELMRVSRQWRDLLLRKRFGYGHDADSSPPIGGLALFCPACPQPGINLPDNWRQDSPSCAVSNSYLTYLIDGPYRWLYRRNIVVDGNFSQEHMRMKRPEDDISLRDGLGYMVESGPYENHLDLSSETIQVCHTSWIMQLNALDKLKHIKESHMCKPQGNQPSKCQQKEPGFNWHWCMCMCSPWLLYPTCCC
jgi:hypothetical protein